MLILVRRVDSKNNTDALCEETAVNVFVLNTKSNYGKGCLFVTVIPKNLSYEISSLMTSEAVTLTTVKKNITDVTTSSNKTKLPKPCKGLLVLF